jgi:hypothetical protein
MQVNGALAGRPKRAAARVGAGGAGAEGSLPSPPRLAHTESRRTLCAREVHVNAAGGPERDETGLPPVDVEIPDDARELDRDVQAYHREQRAERRRRRSRRLHLTLGRDGMVMPMLICCLIFALITGTLLTLFTATSIDQTGLPGAGKLTSPGATVPTPATLTPAPAPLEMATVGVAGKPVLLRMLARTVLLVVPDDCNCNPVVTRIASLATAAHEDIFLVTAPTGLAQAQRLVSQLGHGLQPVTDLSGDLAGADYTHPGLTAVVVSEAGYVSYADQLQNASNLPTVIQTV